MEQENNRTGNAGQTSTGNGSQSEVGQVNGGQRRVGQDNGNQGRAGHDKKTTERKSKRGGSKPGALAHNKSGAGLPSTDNVAPGENARFIRFAMASWDLPPIDISDPQQVKDRIALYFQHCAENDRKPQVIGMANWLGVDRDTINNWKRGVVRKDTHSGIVQKALAMLEEMWADYMQNGKINPASGIFLAKNWFGYKDIQDVVVTPQAPYETGSAEDVAARYIEGMVGSETVDGGDGEVK